VLRRNNFSRPVDFVPASAEHVWAKIDKWRAGVLVHSDSVALSGPTKRAQRTLASGHDQKLTELLVSFSPDASAPTVEPAEGHSETVLFIDYPGEDERSWRRAYKSMSGQRAYVHPFIDEDRSAGEQRYALVLQYWFFYPFNDGANNHEGDWEHISVILTTREQERAPTLQAARLGEAQLQRLLSGSLPIDSLTIAAVEYFFHETYAVVDYLAARREPAHASGLGEVTHLHLWQDPDLVNRVIRDRLRDAKLATHPIGFIGGNNRGPDELTRFWPRFQSGYNRNGHGTYPFPGTWQAVGPLGLTEQLSGPTTPTLKQADSTLTFADEHFLSFNSSDLILIPDWERMWPAMMDDAALRSAWAWLLLPLRWGYPASRSPGAGAMKNVNLGNVSPEGPAFHPGWNRLGQASGWPAYDLNALRVLLVPTMPWARVRNGWGFLNLPVGLLALMPGWNVLTSQAIPWVAGSLRLFGAPPATTFYPGKPPFRFASTAAGFAWIGDADEFTRLLPAATSENGVTLPPDGFPSGTADIGVGRRFWLNVFQGRKLSLENTLTLARANLSNLTNGDTSFISLDGVMELRELTSGFRLNAFSTNDDRMQYYNRAGWGYTWYELRNVTGIDVDPTERFDGGYAPSLLPSGKWWPNTWYLGMGLELFLPKSRGLLQRVGLGARMEGSVAWHRLELEQPAFDLGWARRTDVSIALLLAW
jgi:hypothetical protein